MSLKKWIIIMAMIFVFCGSEKGIADESECPIRGEHLYSAHYYYKQVNEIYHVYVATCLFCGYEHIESQGNHFYPDWADKRCLEKATPMKNGLIEATCSICDYKTQMAIPWKYGGEFCQTYDIVDHSLVYEDSRSITVTVQRALKGAVLKVKIGKKTYTKKLKSNSNSRKKIKLKIGRHACGSNISIRMYYKNRVIGKDLCEEVWDDYIDCVWYARNIKTGMTKKQAKYTWGEPYDSDRDSNGNEYWFYDDGAYIRFRGGRVVYWHT